VQQLKKVFSSVGACSEDITPSAEDTPNIFDHIENEVNALDEVIAGHGDFCALLASRGTTTEFMKASCTHANTVNRPTFSLSPTDLVDIPSEAQSIENRFITQIWAKGGRELAGEEARNPLKPVWNLYLLLALSLVITFYLIPFVCMQDGGLIIRSPFRRLLKLLFRPTCIGLRKICIILVKNYNRGLSITVYICPYLVIYFYLFIHVQIALLWTKLVSFEPKAKTPSLLFVHNEACRCITCKLLKRRFFVFIEALSSKMEYLCSCFML
jgi:hypothetical protein